MGWLKRGEWKLGERGDRKGNILQKTQGKYAPQALPPLPSPALPCHNRGPAPALPKVWNMKARFLPFSTIGPFTLRCLYNDRGLLPLSCADRPKKSCWVLWSTEDKSTPVAKTCWQTDTKLSETSKHFLLQSPSEMVHLSQYNPWTLDGNTEPAVFSLLSQVFCGSLKNVPPSYLASQLINSGNALVVCFQCSSC